MALSENSGFYDEFLYAKYPLKDGKIHEKLSRETRLRKFKVNITRPLGVAPIGLNLLVCAKTGGKMVVDVISRSKFPLPAIRTRKNFLMVLCNGESENWPCQIKTKLHGQGENTRASEAVENPRESMLAKMHEAVYVTHISICLCHGYLTF